MKRSAITKRRTPRSVLKMRRRKKVRLAVYERAGGLCELKLRNDCVRGVLAFKGETPWDHGHLVHKKSEGSGGKTDMENCCWGCWKCHLLGLHRGEYDEMNKPCPPKQREILTETKDWTLGYYGN